MRSINKPGCDIFCSVIDNYGDIGVCWRLAKQFSCEHGLAVRLWVDDLASFSKLCPTADSGLQSQLCCGVQVCLWGKAFADVEPAAIVIEAFACKLPESYIAAMAVQPQPPIWINLEYLSAEGWVQSCHKLPSPHPRLPLTKHFFFPGFTKQTGGLLLEHDLLARRDAFHHDVSAQQAFWRGIGMTVPLPDTLKISLFAYENAALASLFDAWANGTQTVLCLVPEGRILAQVEQYFSGVGQGLSRLGEVVGMSSDLQNYARGNLQVRILPFVAQEKYDELLWVCDVNFVRGEDSCVRAQWAGKPFVWQIYAQHDKVHKQKLQAFLDVYSLSLSASARQGMQSLWNAWNGDLDAGENWNAFAAGFGELATHSREWAQFLAENTLALNLLDFCAEIGRIHAFKIEGQ